MRGARADGRAVPARGVALVMVLWCAALASILAAGFSFSLRTEARLAAGVVDRARAGAAAEAGVRRLMAVLAAGERRKVEPVAASMTFAGLTVQVALAPENSRVDLNAAPAPLLESLVAHVASTLDIDAPAKDIAEAILDWRDTDSVARPAGAEAAEYEAAGLAARPRNSAFLSVSELTRVKGVAPRLYQALEPLVTVYAWSPQVDPMSAPRDVLLALPEVTAADVDAFLAARTADPGDRRAVTALAGAQRYLARGSGTVFAITARATTASGVTAVRRAVVKLSGSVQRPVSVLAWFEDAPTVEPDGAGDAADGVPAVGG